MNYLKDPKTDEPSVSLSLTLATFIPLLVFTIKSAVEGNLDPLNMLFITTATLYFGRRLDFGKKIIEQKEENK